MVKRFVFPAIALSFAAIGIAAWAQQTDQVPVLGVLMVTVGPGEGPVEALPRLSRVAVFWDTYSQRQFDELQPAARSLGVQIQSIELRAPYEFKAAFRSAKQKKAGAAIVLFSVDRLLKGAKPSDLPVELATGFKLTVNLKMAKALRLTIPDSIVLRADEVIR